MRSNSSSIGAHLSCTGFTYYHPLTMEPPLHVTAVCHKMWLIIERSSWWQSEEKLNNSVKSLFLEENISGESWRIGHFKGKICKCDPCIKYKFTFFSDATFLTLNYPKMTRHVTWHRHYYLLHIDCNRSQSYMLYFLTWVLKKEFILEYGR